MVTHALRTTFSKSLSNSIFKRCSSTYDNLAQAAKDMKDKAECTAQQETEIRKEATEEVTKTAHELSENAKQIAEDAVGSMKDMTQKMKDAMAGKADDSKQVIKENADTITRSMNSKN